MAATAAAFDDSNYERALGSGLSERDAEFQSWRFTNKRAVFDFEDRVVALRDGNWGDVSWRPKPCATGVAGPRNLTGARELVHELCRTDHFGCEKRFLLDRFLRDWARWIVWGLEVLLLLGSPVLLVRRVRSVVRPRWISVSAAILVTIAAVLASVQVAYFAWGTTLQSVFWMGAGLPWVWIAWLFVRQRNPQGAESHQVPS